MFIKRGFVNVIKIVLDGNSLVARILLSIFDDGDGFCGDGKISMITKNIDDGNEYFKIENLHYIHSVLRGDRSAIVTLKAPSLTQKFRDNLFVFDSQHGTFFEVSKNVVTDILSE